MIRSLASVLGHFFQEADTKESHTHTVVDCWQEHGAFYESSSAARSGHARHPNLFVHTPVCGSQAVTLLCCATGNNNIIGSWFCGGHNAHQVPVSLTNDDLGLGVAVDCLLAGTGCRARNGILVGVDCSEASVKAAEFACKTFPGKRLDLVMCFCVPAEVFPMTRSAVDLQPSKWKDDCVCPPMNNKKSIRSER